MISAIFDHYWFENGIVILFVNIKLYLNRIGLKLLIKSNIAFWSNYNIKILVRNILQKMNQY